MDTKKTLRRSFPFTAIIFALIACAAFYFCRTHDAKLWHEIDAYYVSHLLKIEQALYLDFYQKRLSIQQKGSEKQLQVIKQTIHEKQSHTLTRLILSDRSFRDFLVQKAPIYFSDKQTKNWQQHNLKITDYLAQLPSYQFALIPERFTASPQAATLFTYIFVEQNLFNFLSNLVLFFLLCWLAEKYFPRTVLLKLLFGSILLHAGLYIAVSTTLTPPLSGLNMQVYVFFAALLSAFLRRNYPIKSSKNLTYLCLGMAAVLLIAKIVLDSYLGIFTATFLICLISLCVIALVSGWLISGFFLPHQMSAATSLTEATSMTTTLRKQYSDAMNAISRFNFNYARQQLRLLVDQKNYSGQILESSYHLEKLVPEESYFWLLAKERIDQCLINENYSEMLAIFQDIQKAAPSRASASTHISPDHYLKMLVVFVNHGNIEKAEHAFMFLELAGDSALVQEACKLLIETFSSKYNLKKQTHYQALLDSYLKTN